MFARAYDFIMGLLLISASIAAVGVLGLLLSDSEPLKNVWAEITAPGVGAEVNTPHDYLCALCDGTIQYVRTADGFTGEEEHGPACQLAEGDTILVKGKTSAVVIAEVSKQVVRIRNDDFCRMNQRILFDKEEWRSFLRAIATTQKEAKIMEEVKQYTLR
jgi:hypothetical protein